MSDTCKNCGARVVLVNFAMGKTWMHQPSGAAFSDNMSEHCKSTRAEPKTRL